MSLSDGMRLGAYEITGRLGAGGMGEVYRARDTKLDREVAIKTLPAGLASDKDRLARFEREAKLLASLNHAHIASVYGLDEHEGSLYIAMELVEGETLEAKLKAGAMPVGEALRLGLQIAEALEAAHQKGVVHRDLKPANVMVNADGVVKVLDFGLAKAFSGAPDEAGPAHSPALSLAMTQQGLVLGTAGYMSPEQASGQGADQRADVWAFGVLLYEMLTGMPLFSGESVPHILADVLRADPDWDRLPQKLHPRIRELLERCLEKKPRNRYSGIADARVDIERALADPRGVEPVPETPARRRSAWPIAAVAIVAAVLAGFAGWLARPTPELQVDRFVDAIPSPISDAGVLFRAITIAPDGRRYIFTGDDGFYVREMDQPDAQHIASTSQTMASPMFAPDSRQFAAWERGSLSLRRASVSGGSSIQVSSIETPSPFGGQWYTDDTIVFAGREGIRRVAAAGGEPTLVVPPEDGYLFLEPRLLPDGESLLFTRRIDDDVTTSDDTRDLTDVVIWSPSTREPRTLIAGAFSARYLSTGHIVFAQGTGLFGVAFDAETLSLRGGATSLVENVDTSDIRMAQYDVADDGTLVYLTGGSGVPKLTVVWVDRGGQETPIPGLGSRDYAYVQLSPDGRSLALDARGNEDEIFVFDLEQGTTLRLTFDIGSNRGPLWLGNDRIVFTREIDGEEEIYVQSADGSGTPEPLTVNSGTAVIATDVSEDYLLFNAVDRSDDDDVQLLSLTEPDAEPRRLIATPAIEWNAQLSPNGRFVAYQEGGTTPASGRGEIFVRPFPDVDAGGLWQVSIGGGTAPRWSRDGSELFYAVRDAEVRGRLRLMSVPVEIDDSFRFGSPTVVIEGDYVLPNTGRMAYDVSLDGERFLLLKRDLGVVSQEPKIVVVQNWVEELRRRVPAN